MATMREVLEEAMKEGRRWQSLSYAATYLQEQMEKGRMNEEMALEKLLTAVPGGPHGRLIRRSLLETRNFSRELDDLIHLGQSMADAMAQIAPFYH
jgi:hypothetical protein